MQNHVKIVGAMLAEDETHRGECPECGHKDTLTITRKQDALVWNCYSASCHSHGAIGGRRTLVANLLHNKPDHTKAKTNPFLGELEPLPLEWEVYLNALVGFDSKHLALAGAYYAPFEHRIAYPIFSPMGARRGWCLRSYSLGVAPKSYTYMDTVEPHLAWYRPHPKESRVIIVEDIPSAVRAARYFPQAVAMCGGGIGVSYVAEIAKYARNVTWAFDQDATISAIQHHKRYALLFDSSVVLPLPKDLKDMKENELCDILSERQES